MTTKLKQIWYGEKTFHILKNFIYQGITFYANNIFTCDRETYNDYKKFLGEEYIVKQKIEQKEEFQLTIQTDDKSSKKIDKVNKQLKKILKKPLIKSQVVKIKKKKSGIFNKFKK